MALRDRITLVEMQELIQLLQESPDDKEKIIDKYNSIVDKNVCRLIRKIYVFIFTNLYSYDYEALKLDITKYAVLNPSRKPSKKERADLLIILLNNLPAYLQNDYSVILNECERVIETRKTLQETNEDLPFV